MCISRVFFSFYFVPIYFIILFFCLIFPSCISYIQLYSHTSLVPSRFTFLSSFHSFPAFLRFSLSLSLSHRVIVYDTIILGLLHGAAGLLLFALFLLCCLLRYVLIVYVVMLLFCCAFTIFVTLNDILYKREIAAIALTRFLIKDCFHSHP